MNAVKARQKINICAFVYIISCLIYYLIASVVEVEASTQNDQWFRFWSFVIVVVIALSVFLYPPSKIHQKKAGGTPLSGPQEALTKFIMDSAMAEGIALYSLVYYFMTGSKELLNIFVPVSIVLILVIRSMTRVEPTSSGTTPYAFKEKDQNE